MTIKFYTDTHIAKAVAFQLRQDDIDIVRCEEVDMALADNFEHIIFATEPKRSIMTHDQGFTGHHRQWLSEGKHHCGIFLITKDKDDIGMIIRNLTFWADSVAAEAASLENDVYDQIIYLP